MNDIQQSTPGAADGLLDSKRSTLPYPLYKKGNVLKIVQALESTENQGEISSETYHGTENKGMTFLCETLQISTTNKVCQYVY